MSSKPTVSQNDDGKIAPFPRKARLWYRIIKWVRRLLKVSEDPDAAEAFFKSFR